MDTSNITCLTCSHCVECFWPVIDIAYGQGVLIFLHVITLTTSILGNVLLITLITRKKSSLLEESAYILIASVSVADLLMSLLSQPLHIYFIVTGARNAGKYTQILFFVCVWGFGGASAFGIACITLDRFIYIVYPMRYRDMLSRQRTIALIFIQWVCGMSYGILPMLDQKNGGLPTSIASLITLIGLTVAMAALYKQVNDKISILKNTQKRQAHNNKTKQRNATTTIFFIVITFFFCWFPYLLVNLFKNAQVTFTKNQSFYGILFWLLALGCWNSSFNVFIYGFKNTTLKNEAKKMFRRGRSKIGNELTASVIQKKDPDNDQFIFNVPSIIKNGDNKELDNTVRLVDYSVTSLHPEPSKIFTLAQVYR